MAPHILVVDDEPAIGKLLLYQLSGFGYRVTYLQNGLLALQRFMLDRPDLVILDVMMPQISGLRVIHNDSLETTQRFGNSFCQNVLSYMA